MTNNNGRLQLCPFLRIFFFLGLGVMAGSATQGMADSVVWQWIYAVIAIAALVSCLMLKQQPTTQTVILFMLLFAGGAWRAGYHARQSETYFTDRIENYHAIVCSTPLEKKHSMKCNIAITDGRLAGHHAYAYLQTSDKSRKLHTGDGIAVSSRFDSPAWNFQNSKNNYNNNGKSGHFDYNRWLAVNDIVARTYIADNNWQRADADTKQISAIQRMTLRFSNIRTQFLRLLSRCGIRGQSYALVSAMVVGDRSAITADMRNIYSDSGASHILALSGLHMGIIYAILTMLLIPRNRSSVIRMVLGNVALILVMWVYAIMVGMSPSVVRSAFMFSMLAIASIMERGNSSLNSLGLVATILLLANPTSLWDVSFQMSFVAVFGILMCNERFRNLEKSNIQMRYRCIDWVWQMTKVSVAAQISVAPLVMYYFGQFPCYFLLANFIAVPLATTIIYTSLLLALVSLIPWLPELAPWLTTTIGAALQWQAETMNDTLAWIGTLPGATVKGIAINGLQAAALYILIIIMYAASFHTERLFRIMSARAEQ